MAKINKVVLLFFCFLINSPQKSDFFDFYKEYKIKDLGVFEIDKITNSKIVFDPDQGDIINKILCDNKTIEFNLNGTYKLTSPKSLKHYYFKFGWQDFNGKIKFSNINWLKNRPFFGGKYYISEVYIPFVQDGKFTICTIGDSQTWWSNGKYLRKFMNQSNNDFIFVGSNQDVFGYPHEGEGGNNTKDVIERLQFVPKSDVYTLLLGTNDYQNSINEASNNINFIVDELIKKNPKSKIFYLTPLPTANNKRNEFNEKLKELVINNNKDKIIVISLGEFIRNLSDWEQFFTDGLHLNKEGYQKISVFLTLEINKWIKE